VLFERLDIVVAEGDVERVGVLDLSFEAMEFPAHPGLTMLVYTAAGGTPAADSLKLLASWAATAEQTGDLPASV
jgi:hypothetical protein